MDTKLAERKDYELMSDSLQMAANVITKDYLNYLEELPVAEVPVELTETSVGDYARLYKLKKIVTDKDENTIEKMLTVLNTAYSSNASVVSLIRGHDGEVEYYMGIVSKDLDQEAMDVNTQSEIFHSALLGNFPGLSLEPSSKSEIENIRDEMFLSGDVNVTAISGLASVRNENDNDMDSYVQGLEHLLDSLKGRTFTILLLADPVSSTDLAIAKNGYENLYSQLSPFLNTSMSLNEGETVTLTESQTKGFSTSISESVSETQGTSETNSWSKTTSKGTSKNKNTAGAIGTVAGGAAAAGVAIKVAAKEVGKKAVSAAATALTGGAAVPLLIASAASLGGALGSSIFGSTGENETVSDQEGGSQTTNENHTHGTTTQQGEQESTTESQAAGKTTGKTLQYSSENRGVKGLLDKIDGNIERIENCESYGAFQCAAYVISSDSETNAVVASGYNALMKGEKSSLQSSHINQWDSTQPEIKTVKEYLKTFSHPQFIYDNTGDTVTLVSPALLENSREVAIGMGLPKKSLNGLPVMESAPFGRNILCFDDDQNAEKDDKIHLGSIYHMGSVEENSSVDLSTESLSMHTFITGSTGSGKSNTVYQILNGLRKKKVNFLVIEPTKGEYKNVFGSDSDVHVYGTNPYTTPLLRINPFKFDKGIHVLEHIDRLVEIFNVCWPMYAAMPAVLKEAILQAYEVCGWDLTRSVNTISDDLFPTFQDLLTELVNVIENSAYDEELKSNYKGSLETRVKSLTNGLNGLIFSPDEIDNERLFDENVIIDLSRVGSLETKSLIMGVLVMRLNEYRMTHTEGMNNPLKHVTVLEEAHNLLKRTSTEQSSEEANVAGKSVEMISNAIAEMRTYGEGFIIVDQSPAAVDMSAIRNTNTKIIMRLPEESDRRTAGKSAALKDEQLDELARLPQGVAVVYQNNWIEAVLCKIEKTATKETPYKYSEGETQFSTVNERAFRKELLKLLLKGRINEDIDIDIDLLRESLPDAGISTQDKLVIYDMVNEYEKNDKSLDLWKDENFGMLSKLVTDLMDCRNRVDNLIATVPDFPRLDQELSSLIAGIFDADSDNLSQKAEEELVLSIAQCLMKESCSAEKDEVEIYAAWRDDIVKRGGLL